jgi:hypothetical protein
VMADEKLLLPDFFELFAIRIFDWFINQLIKQKLITHFFAQPIYALDSNQIQAIDLKALVTRIL